MAYPESLSEFHESNPDASPDDIIAQKAWTNLYHIGRTYTRLSEAFAKEHTLADKTRNIKESAQWLIDHSEALVQFLKNLTPEMDEGQSESGQVDHLQGNAHSALDRLEIDADR